MTTSASPHVNAFLQQVERIKSVRDGGVAVVSSVAKTSAAAPSIMEKVSARVATLRELGTLLEALGTRGFEKTAMDAADLSSFPLETGSAMDNGSGTPDTPRTYVSNPEVSGGNVEPEGGASPPVHTPGPGEAAAREVPSETGPVPENSNVQPDGVKASALLRKVVGNRFPLDPSGRALTKASSANILARMGVSSAVDAVSVFYRTAQREGVKLSTYLEGLELHIAEKSSAARLVAERTLHKTSEEVDNDIAKAKAAVEAVVKSQLQLPESAAIAQAANVSPMAADIAIHETAELIAATGGQIGNAVSPLMGAGAPPMPAVGTPPPAAGMVPGAPMGPSPMAPPAMTPAAPMAPPGMDPNAGMAPPMAPPGMDPNAGMQVQSSVDQVRALVADPARLDRHIEQFLAKSSDTTIADDPAKEMAAADSSSCSTVVAPEGTGPVSTIPEAPVTERLRAFLSSDSSAFSADPNDVANVSDGDILKQFRTPITRQDAGGVTQGSSHSTGLSGDLALGNQKASHGDPTQAVREQLRAAFPIS